MQEGQTVKATLEPFHTKSDILNHAWCANKLSFQQQRRSRLLAALAAVATAIALS
jgi:hypothetical protein